MPITNPTPVERGTADKLWASRITITPITVTATLWPYDGQYILGGATKIDLLPTRWQAGDAISLLAATVGQMLDGVDDDEPTKIEIVGPDPSAPVTLAVDGKIIVPDLFALLAQQEGGPGLADAVYQWLAAAVSAQAVRQAEIAAKKAAAAENVARINTARIAAGKEPV